MIVERLSVFASARDDRRRSSVMTALRAAGVVVWVWPAAAPRTLPPAGFDAVLVLAEEGELTPEHRAALTALLRQAWSRGATIGLFGAAAVALMSAAAIVADGVPIEAPGLFIDDGFPEKGTIEEWLDALRSGPHLDR